MDCSLDASYHPLPGDPSLLHLHMNPDAGNASTPHSSMQGPPVSWSTGSVSTRFVPYAPSLSPDASDSNNLHSLACASESAGPVSIRDEHETPSLADPTQEKILARRRNVNRNRRPCQTCAKHKQRVSVYDPSVLAVALKSGFPECISVCPSKEISDSFVRGLPTTWSRGVPTTHSLGRSKGRVNFMSDW